MGKWCLHASSFIFVRIESSFLVNDCHLGVSPVTILILIIKVAGNQDRHKSLDEFDFGPLVSMAHLCVFWNERMSSSACGWSKDLFLAHLSRRLTRWAYRMGLEPASVRACVHTFKYEYIRDQQADYNQILSETSLGWGKGCIRFWCRSDQNSGFHGNG